MSRQPRSIIDTDDATDPMERVLDFMAGGQRQIDMPDREFAYDEFGKSLELEAFMHEPVVIQIVAPPTDNEPPICFAGVNGDQRVLPRDIPIRVPRKFVECIARSHEAHIKQRLSKDPEANEMYINRSVQRPAYPVMVLQDKNPVGRRWFKRIVAEGC